MKHEANKLAWPTSPILHVIENILDHSAESEIWTSVENATKIDEFYSEYLRKKKIGETPKLWVSISIFTLNKAQLMNYLTGFVCH